MTLPHIIPEPSAIEFHLSRLARDRFQFDRDLLVHSGEFAEPDRRAVQDLAHRLNQRQGAADQAVKPGALFALVLLQQILHRVLERYRRDREPRLFEHARDWLAIRFSPDGVEILLRRFGEHYAPLPVYRLLSPLPQFMNVTSNGRTGRDELLEQMLLVYLANINHAARTTRDLYDDRELAVRKDYLEHISALETYFGQLPPYGPRRQSLFELLQAPIKAAPDSLLGQLEYIRQNWAEILGEDLLRLLMRAQDLVREEERGFHAPAPGQMPDPDYLRALASRRFSGAEYERFSADVEWMPRVVLLAKSVYVWLDQLSKRYGRHIRRLDEIPDEELDRLQAWGFTGLWLIGLWERSGASRMIKHIRGNPDAVASAYSIYDYHISGDLGGDSALDNLRGRALARGIRLASDLVPNHMGIDSRWTREHPDWFVQSDYPPYESYRFTGPDLSGDGGISVRIEDGYWNQTDAAVVYQRVDHQDGRTRYIYHGNDGTSMPWNDTAQLNFLLPDVREAVIRLIIDVARRFPILRFDAAMTLTKQHYQRLWFPEPGTGGAIPSRSLFGLTHEEFDRAMPEEFWRQVVDRVAVEAPDTLLLAEAFWLLEGFFVRTLGMHRVYNSAFMNLLKLEENAKYRQVLKNILEFDPRILQRFVNFMNNPDEETAVAQFGKGDKYFGVCMMMATMPGLPMFGHGQIEGLTERYGHEYQRAYYDEHADDDLVRRHEREIFPVLRLRHLFAGADRFLLYDVFHDDGSVDENIFAFSNGFGRERALVVFHNRYAEASGWIRLSAAFAAPDGHGGRKLVQRTLGEGLDIRGDAGLFYVLKDRITNLEYLRRGSELRSRGLHIHLAAYQYQVFTEFREIPDDAEGRWARLEDLLGGRGVPSLEREFKRVFLAPLISAYNGLLSAANVRELLDGSAPAPVRAAAFAQKARPFLEQATIFGGRAHNVEDVARELEHLTLAALVLPAPEKHMSLGRAQQETRNHLLRALPDLCDASRPFWRIITGWLAAWGAIRVTGRDAEAAPLYDDWLLGETQAKCAAELGAAEAEAWLETETVRALLTHHRLAASFAAPRRFTGTAAMLDDPVVLRLIGCHSHNNIVWFHRESWESLSRWLFVMTALDLLANAELKKNERGAALSAAHRRFHELDDLAALADYQFERFKTLLSYAAATPKRPVPAAKTPARKSAKSEK